MLLSPSGEPILVLPAGDDPTSEELRLSGTSAQRVTALLSPPYVDSFPGLSTASPGLAIHISGEDPQTLVFDSDQGLNQVISQIHAALGQHAIATRMDDRILVVPRTTGVKIMFGTTAEDAETLQKLGLYTARSAITGDIAELNPGPRTRIERSTIFGAVHVREFDMASESIFIGQAIVQKQQAGCTRFCYLAGRSRVPRRFRCQPDLALTTYAQTHGHASTSQMSDQTMKMVAGRVTPTFTSTRFGDPGFAQLGHACPDEIKKGAEDGSEMGVFQHLKQAQREANLLASLNDHLRVGFEAGLFFVT